MKIDDPIERIIAEGLTKAGIKFIHETEDNAVTKALDFYLPDLNIYIEVKQFWSENLNKQMQRVDNIIAIQGREAAKAFMMMLNPISPYHSP